MKLSQLPRNDIEYFHLGKCENPDFWTRFGGKPELKSKRVLDLGCGHGSLCVDIAQSGASKVVGVDLDERRIAFAKEFTRLHYPELVENLEFLSIDIKDYDSSFFDYMVSKYTFEHIIDLAKVLQEMKKRLKPGGRIYTGFGPLYYSPVGDHGRTHSFAPWGHVCQTETMIIQRLNRKRSDRISSIYDLGLNKLTPADYRRIFAQSGFKLVFYRENLVMPSASTTRKMIGQVMSLFKAIPFLEKYFTVNIWCILENRGDSANESY
jgi:SAM-dependent methyltransferase